MTREIKAPHGCMVIDCAMRIRTFTVISPTATLYTVFLHSSIPVTGPILSLLLHCWCPVSCLPKGVDVGGTIVPQPCGWLL